MLIAGIVLPKALFKLTDDVQRFQNQFFKVHIIILRNSSLHPVASQSVDQIGFQWNPQGPVIIASAGTLNVKTCMNTSWVKTAKTLKIDWVNNNIPNFTLCYYCEIKEYFGDTSLGIFFRITPWLVEIITASQIWFQKLGNFIEPIKIKCLKRKVGKQNFLGKVSNKKQFFQFTGICHWIFYWIDSLESVKPHEWRVNFQQHSKFFLSCGFS